MFESFSINAYTPRPVVDIADEAYQETLQTENESYVITEGIGFDTASFILTGELEYLLAWYKNGLVRHIEWTAPDDLMAWEGYVNRLSLTVGASTRTISVDKMANRVIFIYTPLDTTANPPVAGAQTSTTVNDTTSQGRYGIKVHIENGGECTAATASDAALSILDQKSRLPQGEKVAVGRGSIPSLKVEMRGYAHMANWYNYTQTQLTGTVAANTFVGLVLTDDPNGVMSTSTINIDDNATAIERYHDGKEFGWKLLRMAADRGFESGGTGYAWTVGMYNRRRVTFKQAESVDSYGNPLSTNKYLMLYRQTTDAGDSILNEAGEEIMPWAIRPDRLLYTSGFPGRPMWITQCKFSTPFQLDLAGTDPMNPTKSYLMGGCGKS